MQNATTRLHPLLTAAAVSLILLSGVGVAALTGMMPVTRSQDTALDTPREETKPVARPQLEPVRVVEAPRPVVPAGPLATVESVREVKAPGEAKGVGALAGGAVGGVLGNKLGKGKGIAMVLGAAGGAFAGHQIEKQVRAEKRWEISLRLDDGSQRTLPSEVEPAWRAGDRVRLVDNNLQAI
jgi:outer membrane lipoprotein SlyB